MLHEHSSSFGGSPYGIIHMQLSMLRVFHATLADSSLRKKPEFEPLLRFATRVVRNMFER